MNRPTTQTAPNLQTTAFIYGKGSLLDRVSIDGSAYLTNIAYNARGQRTDVWFANGSKTRYEYDSDTFRLTRLLTTRNSGVDVLQDITYTYDPEGNIVEQSDAAQQTYYFNNSVVSPTGLYEYDALYRLIKAQGRELTNLTMATESDFVNTLSVPNAGSNAMQNYTQMFSYDELGNLQTMQSQGRWSRSYIYDNVTNRLLRHEGTNNVYNYDAHGNMTSMPHLSSMTWNSSDMLRSATNGTFSSYYSYNAAGDRVRKGVDNGITLSTATNSIRYQYDVTSKFKSTIFSQLKSTTYKEISFTKGKSAREPNSQGRHPFSGYFSKMFLRFSIR